MFKRLYLRLQRILIPHKKRRIPLEPIPLAIKCNRQRSSAKVGVVVHIYYADLISEIVTALRNIFDPFDLHVTTPHRDLLDEIYRKFHFHVESLSIHLVENIGRDIAPFIHLYREGYLDEYEYVLKLHSKKSIYSQNGSDWRVAIYDELVKLPLSYGYVKKIFNDSSVGMVGPEAFYLTDPKFWGANEPLVRKIISECAPNMYYDQKLGFFAGSMFWFRPTALELLKKPNDTFFEYLPETGRQDGCMAHALERSFCILVRMRKFIVTSPKLEGQEINDLVGTAQNTVPVLS